MIGIFDSGLGGLTALREAVRLLPGRDIVYFGDTGRVPYGTRSAETITRYAVQDMRFLCSHGVDIVLAACGTVSSTALDTIRDEFSLPVIGVVEGAALAAVRATKNKKIGVIATGATISSGAFPHAIGGADASIAVTAVACPMLVPLVENGYIADDDPVTALVLSDYLAPIRAAGCDTLLLGCTHYPLFRPALVQYLPKGTLILDSAAAAADYLTRLLRENGLCAEPGRTGSARYYVTDRTPGFERLARRFLDAGDGETIDIHLADVVN